MPSLFDQENNNIAECAEDGMPRTAQRQPLHAGQTDRETTRQAHTEKDRQNNQEKRRATMRQTETSNNTTNKQDKTREQQIIRQIKLKKKRCRK